MSRAVVAGKELRPTSRRLENFSDAVFAIVLTIMVFEIKIPDGLVLGNSTLALRQFSIVLGTTSSASMWWRICGPATTI